VTEIADLERAIGRLMSRLAMLPCKDEEEIRAFLDCCRELEKAEWMHLRKVKQVRLLNKMDAPVRRYLCNVVWAETLGVPHLDQETCDEIGDVLTHYQRRGDDIGFALVALMELRMLLERFGLL